MIPASPHASSGYCFYCLSLWVAIPFALFLGGGWGERLLLWPALSAGAILLERVGSNPRTDPPVYYEEEGRDDMLRKEEGGDSGADG